MGKICPALLFFNSLFFGRSPFIKKSSLQQMGLGAGFIQTVQRMQGLRCKSTEWCLDLSWLLNGLCAHTTKSTIVQPFRNLGEFFFTILWRQMTFGFRLRGSKNPRGSKKGNLSSCSVRSLVPLVSPPVDASVTLSDVSSVSPLRLESPSPSCVSWSI